MEETTGRGVRITYNKPSLTLGPRPSWNWNVSSMNCVIYIFHNRQLVLEMIQDSYVFVIQKHLEKKEEMTVMLHKERKECSTENAINQARGRMNSTSPRSA